MMFFIPFLLLLQACYSRTLADFDLPLVKNEVRLALAAYCGNSLVNQNWSCFWCKQVSPFTFSTKWNDPERSTFGFVGVSGSTIHVSWRGTVTTDMTGWLQDFNMLQVPYPYSSGAEVHKGFYDQFSFVKDSVLQAVQAAVSKCPSCNKMIFTGHSLGGALCTLHALEVIQAGLFPPEKVFLWTFGGPRQGNAQFASFVESSIPIENRWRVVNKRDIVPHGVLQAFGYRHFGPEVWTKSDSQTIVCDDGESSSCSDQLWITNILDHASALGITVADGVLSGCLLSTNNAFSATVSQVIQENNATFNLTRPPYINPKISTQKAPSPSSDLPAWSVAVISMLSVTIVLVLVFIVVLLLHRKSDPENV